MSAASPRSPAGISRRGVALPAALLVLLVLTFTGAAALALGGHERTLAWSDEALVRARMASEAGLRVASGDLMDVPPGEAVPPGWPGGFEWTGDIGTEEERFRVRLAPLDAEHGLLLSQGTSARGHGARHHLGRLVWRPVPDRRLEALEAVLVHGGEYRRHGSAGIARDPVEEPGWLDPGGPGGEACDPFRQRVHAALEGRSPPLRSGYDAAGSGGAPSLGRWDGNVFRRAAVRSGLLTPEGSLQEDGAAENGDGPDEVEGLPVFVAPDGLAVEGGEILGVVWAPGDLELAGAATLHGVLLVEGELELRDQAAVHGHVRVEGDVDLRDQAILTGSGCALLRVLEGTPRRAAALPVPDGGWLSLPRP